MHFMKTTPRVEPTKYQQMFSQPLSWCTWFTHSFWKCLWNVKESDFLIDPAPSFDESFHRLSEVPHRKQVRGQTALIISPKQKDWTWSLKVVPLQMFDVQLKDRVNAGECVTHCRSSRTLPLSGPSSPWGSSREGWSAGNGSSLAETACFGQRPRNSHSQQTSVEKKGERASERGRRRVKYCICGTTLIPTLLRSHRWTGIHSERWYLHKKGKLFVGRWIYEIEAE